MKLDLIFLFGLELKFSVHPKVKLRQKDEFDGGDERDLVGLKAFLSLSFHSPTSPGYFISESSASIFLLANFDFD